MAGGNIPRSLGPLFVAAGQKYHIDPAVLAGVASVESSLGQDRSTSSAGAEGLMQFLPSTAASYHINPYNDAQAIDGAARYLLSAGYRQNPLRAIGAYNGGPGNPQYGYARQVMAEAARLRGQLAPYMKGAPGSAGQSQAAPGSKPSNTASGYNLQTTPGTPSKVDWNAAIIDNLMKEPKINPNGTFHAHSMLSNIISAVDSGQYTIPGTPSTQQLVPTAAKAAVQNHLNSSKGGDVNPLPGWNLGRTDMGVDAHARVGTPIRAINDSRVVHIFPNWYAGQPYVQLQILNGPNKGKYWYVAEQIDHLPGIGSVIPRNGVVARFAPSGTGIEIGWGSSGWQTLAQATTGYHEGQVTPAGSNFRHAVLHA